MSWSGAVLTPAPGFRRQTRRDGLATMASIDVAELGVDRQEDTIRVDLRHTDQTSVGKVPPGPPPGRHAGLERGTPPPKGLARRLEVAAAGCRTARRPRNGSGRGDSGRR